MICLSVFKRRMFIRTVLVIVLILFGVLLVFIGKQHIVVFANEEIYQDGKIFPALTKVRIKIGEETFELEPGDRVSVEVVGLKNAFLIETLAGGVVDKSITFPLSLKLERMVIISLPLVVAGSSNVTITE